MAYTPNVWSSSDFITAEKMNHIEDGISSSATDSDIAIVINGNKTTHTNGAAIDDYVIVRNSTISGIADGLYKTAAAIPANTAITGASLTAISGGGLNSINNKFEALNIRSAITASDLTDNWVITADEGEYIIVSGDLTGTFLDGADSVNGELTLKRTGETDAGVYYGVIVFLSSNNSYYYRVFSVTNSVLTWRGLIQEITTKTYLMNYISNVLSSLNTTLSQYMKYTPIEWEFTLSSALHNTQYSSVYIIGQIVFVNIYGDNITYSTTTIAYDLPRPLATTNNFPILYGNTNTGTTDTIWAYIDSNGSLIARTTIAADSNVYIAGSFSYIYRPDT